MLIRNTQKLLVALAISALAACGGGNNDANNGANNGNNGANNGADAGNNGGMPDVDNSGVEYASAYQLIFTALQFDNAPANKLNLTLNANIDQSLEFPIIVLLDLSDIDAAAGTLHLDGGSGLKTETEGEYVFDPESDPNGVAATLEAATGRMLAEIPFFGFVATFQFETETQKIVIPIENLNIDAALELSEDGTTASITNGHMEGIITREGGDATLITLVPGGMPISLTSLFNANTLNYNTATGEMVDAGSAEADAWYIIGTFSAGPTVIVE